MRRGNVVMQNKKAVEKLSWALATVGFGACVVGCAVSARWALAMGRV